MTQFDRILCPVDFSDGSRHALAEAGLLARWYEASLVVLHVHASWPMTEMIPSIRSVDARPTPVGDEERERLLAALHRFVEASHLPKVTVEYELADTVEVVPEILRQAARADVVVVGTHGRSGFERLLLGSVAERVLRHAPCPVLVVPPKADPSENALAARRILCPVDFSDASLTAFEYAVSLAEESDATLTLLHAIEVPPELGEASMYEPVDVDAVRAAAEASALRRLRALVPESVRQACTVRTSVVEGRAAREIVRAATDDGDHLIVMGVRGRNAVDVLLFGSNTQYVVRSAPCPVLVVQADAHPATVTQVGRAS